MSRIDRIALLLALVTVIAVALVGAFVFDQMAHLEDEMTYVWQSELIARGDLTITTPPCPKCFLVPFVIDYQGQRFGKYPLGWPVLLAIGTKLGLRWLVNPLLAGLGVWLVYLLGKKVRSEGTGLLAAFLTASSPFFLINSGSLLSHTWTLVLSAALSLAWMDTFLPTHNKSTDPQNQVNQSHPENKVPAWLTTIVIGAVLGGLAVTRPLSATGLAVPFILHAIILFFRGKRQTRLRLVSVAALAAGIASLHFAWQYAVTGDPLLNPYTLWWPYDTIGFGPGVGLQKGGYTLLHAWWNTKTNLNVGASDLFGWGKLSYIFLPFGMIALRRSKSAWLLTGTIISLVLTYMLYWVGAWLFGPRYYFEALPGAAILTAAGILWLAGNPFAAWKTPGQIVLEKARFAVVTWLVVGLVTCNILYYLPQRLDMMTDLYDVSHDYLSPFLEQEGSLTPALVIVHPQEDWIEYGRLLELSNPYHDTPFVFIMARGADEEQAALDAFPERKVWHYYPDRPREFYSAPRQGAIDPIRYE